MSRNRPAATLCLAILSAVVPRMAGSATPAFPASGDGQGACVSLYHNAQHEARRRFRDIGGDYAKGWSTPGLYYATLSARALREFKDAGEGEIKRSCDGPARVTTMARISNATDIATKYDKPYANLSTR